MAESLFTVCVIALCLLAFAIALNHLYLVVRGAEPLSEAELDVLRKYYEATTGLRLKRRVPDEVKLRVGGIVGKDWLTKVRREWDSEFLCDV